MRTIVIHPSRSLSALACLRAERVDLIASFIARSTPSVPRLGGFAPLLERAGQIPAARCSATPIVDSPAGLRADVPVTATIRADREAFLVEHARGSPCGERSAVELVNLRVVRYARGRYTLRDCGGCPETWRQSPITLRALGSARRLALDTSAG